MAQPTATKAIKASNLAQINAKVAELSADKKMPASMQKQALKIKKMTTALQEVSAETIANAMSILNETQRRQRRGVSLPTPRPGNLFDELFKVAENTEQVADLSRSEIAWSALLARPD